MAPRKWLLTQNSELKEIGAFNWTIPAFMTKLSNGKMFNACPQAGACAGVCYARNGTYNFSNVKKAHLEKLEMILNDLEGWKERMLDELTHKRYRGKHVRIHDAGDFFSDEYLLAWLDIARQRPDTVFYCYTKEVSRFRRLVEGPEANKPSNFLYLYSYGGKEDHLLDESKDRVADVFPSIEAMKAAGYTSQDEADIQAIYNDNNLVGIPYNNIPHFNKRMAGKTFKELQADIRARKS